MSGGASFQHVVRDILDLCDLQLQLLSVDSQAAKRKLVSASALAAAGAAIGGSALTILLAGVGFLIAESTSLSTGAALLAVGCIASLLVTLLMSVALRSAKAAAAAMNETKSEFAENLRWLKATLVDPESSPRNQLRGDRFANHESSNSHFTNELQRS